MTALRLLHRHPPAFLSLSDSSRESYDTDLEKMMEEIDYQSLSKN